MAGGDFARDLLHGGASRSGSSAVATTTFQAEKSTGVASAIRVATELLGTTRPLSSRIEMATGRLPISAAKRSRLLRSSASSTLAAVSSVNVITTPSMTFVRACGRA